MLDLLLVLAILYCAFRVMNAHRLLHATIWLALTSATTAILIYTLGAAEVAVIELSVGAGLVTVLFVFAFSIVGEETIDELTLIPRPLVWLLILVLAFVLAWFIYPIPFFRTSALETPFGEVLWEQRSLDVIAQIVLIFSGVMGLIGLLSESHPAAHHGLAKNENEQVEVSSGEGRTAGELPAPDPSRAEIQEVIA